MTATLNRHTIPDAGTVLQRADQKWAKTTAEDTAAPEYLAALTLAVQQQIVDHLAIGGGAPVGPADTEVRQLRAENQRLTESVADLQRRDTAATETIERLMVAESEARQAAATWECEYERVRDERLDEVADQAEVHRHAYEWLAPNTAPAPCECGQPWPRGQRKVVKAKAPEPDPWGDLFGRVRGELSGWPA